MYGEYRNTVDEKGRLIIPPKLREQLGSFTDLKLTKSPNNSLWLFTSKEFEKLDSEINYSSLAMFNSNARILNMTVIAPARDVELDKAGRLSIPQIFREYASLSPKTEVVILGFRNFIEIINVSKYDSLIESLKEKVEEAGNNLSIQRMNAQ